LFCLRGLIINAGDTLLIKSSCDMLNTPSLMLFRYCKRCHNIDILKILNDFFICHNSLIQNKIHKGVHLIQSLKVFPVIIFLSVSILSTEIRLLTTIVDKQSTSIIILLYGLISHNSIIILTKQSGSKEWSRKSFYSMMIIC